MGWFGPRGLASIVFALIVVGESHIPAAHTIALTATSRSRSRLAHGLTAAPLVGRYARWLAGHRGELDGIEVAVPARSAEGPGPLLRSS